MTDTVAGRARGTWHVHLHVLESETANEHPEKASPPRPSALSCTWTTTCHVARVRLSGPALASEREGRRERGAVHAQERREVGVVEVEHAADEPVPPVAELLELGGHVDVAGPDP